MPMFCSIIQILKARGPRVKSSIRLITCFRVILSPSIANSHQMNKFNRKGIYFSIDDQLPEFFFEISLTTEFLPVQRDFLPKFKTLFSSICEAFVICSYERVAVITKSVSRHICDFVCSQINACCLSIFTNNITCLDSF